ncbi:MAG TPA: hypothetical protein VK957_09455 [Lunatimonas sp.]|nr:hypothetical protein [Lunatimonas sp.]
MKRTSQSGMIIVARFHLTIKKQLLTDEIEHDAGDARRDDYNCEIPCGH